MRICVGSGPPARRRTAFTSEKLSSGTMDDGDTFEHHFSKVKRPPLDEAVGFHVELKSREPDEERTTCTRDAWRG